MSAALTRGLTRRPATGSVVRWITLNTSTLAMNSSGIALSSRRRLNRSIEAPIARPGGRALAARPPAGCYLLQGPVVHVEEPTVAARSVIADRPAEPVVVPHRDERLLEHRDPRHVLALQRADLLDQRPACVVLDGLVGLLHQLGGLRVGSAKEVLAAEAVGLAG